MLVTFLLAFVCFLMSVTFRVCVYFCFCVCVYFRGGWGAFFCLLHRYKNNNKYMSVLIFYDFSL